MISFIKYERKHSQEPPRGRPRGRQVPPRQLCRRSSHQEQGHGNAIAIQRASGKHWLKGIDGRKLLIRTQHAALNTLLQGGGAIVMKRGLVMLDALINLNSLDARFVGNIHDEWQIEVREDLSDFVGSLAVECIIKAGEHYNLRCPMDGEYKVGRNWSETH